MGRYIDIKDDFKKKNVGEVKKKLSFLPNFPA